MCSKAVAHPDRADRYLAGCGRRSFRRWPGCWPRPWFCAADRTRRPHLEPARPHRRRHRHRPQLRRVVRPPPRRAPLHPLRRGRHLRARAVRPSTCRPVFSRRSTRSRPTRRFSSAIARSLMSPPCHRPRTRCADCRRMVRPSSNSRRVLTLTTRWWHRAWVVSPAFIGSPTVPRSPSVSEERRACSVASTTPGPSATCRLG